MKTKQLMIKRKLREKSVFKRAEMSVFRPNNNNHDDDDDDDDDDDVVSGRGLT